MARKILEGEQLILAPSYCVVLEDVAPLLAARCDTQSGALTMPPREMAALCIRHRHNTIRGKTVNRGVFSMEWIDQFYWLIDEKTLLAHQLPFALVCMRPQRVLTEMRTYWDYGILSEACPTAPHCVLGDSDDFLMIELRQADTARDQISLGRPTPKQIADKLKLFMTKDPLELARYTLVVHAGELPSAFDDAKRRLDAYVELVLRELPAEPLDHINHPNWVYHYSRFHAARRDYLVRHGLIAPEHEVQGPEQGSLQPLASAPVVGPETSPSGGQSALQRVGRRLYGSVFGHAPELLQSHPRWPAVQPILRRMASISSAQTLVVSSKGLPESLFHHIPARRAWVDEIIDAASRTDAAHHRRATKVDAAPASVPATRRVVSFDNPEGIVATIVRDDGAPQTVVLKSLRMVLDEAPHVGEGSDDKPAQTQADILPRPPMGRGSPAVPPQTQEFDFCICELDARDVSRLDLLVDQLSPRLKDGASIFALHLAQPAITLAEAQALLLNGCLAMDLPCQLYLTGSELGAQALTDFKNGVRSLMTRRPPAVVHGAAVLARALVRSLRANRAAQSVLARTPDIITSIALEITTVHRSQPLTERGAANDARALS